MSVSEEGVSTDILLGSSDVVVDENNLLFVQFGIMSMILTGWWTTDVANNALLFDVIDDVDVVVEVAVDEVMIYSTVVFGMFVYVCLFVCCYYQ